MHYEESIFRRYYSNWTVSSVIFAYCFVQEKESSCLTTGFFALCCRFHYDGWSSMRYCLQGDPPLVVKKKNMYRLTRSCAISGYPLAEQLHDWCHEHNNCSCQDL